MELDKLDPTVVRCPTCRAEQEWSDVCRRCKSDLTLLRAVAAAYERDRRECLEALKSGRPFEALRHALHGQWLRPDPNWHRLTAVSALLANDFEAAAGLARRAGREPA